jgi:hypothetical protein
MMALKRFGYKRKAEGSWHLEGPINDRLSARNATAEFSKPWMSQWASSRPRNPHDDAKEETTLKSE